MRASRPFRTRDSAERVAILLEEYRQVYGLAVFRLNALDQRVPIIIGVLTAMLGTIGALPEEMQTVLLAAMPLTLLWVIRTTINHARSFEDALRRIEEIEQAVSIRAGERLLRFQSSHPSRGKYVGGRTGTETIEAVLAASAILQGGCLYLSVTLIESSGLWQPVFAGYVAVLSVSQIGMRWWMRRYRYQPHA
ncbi:MAG: hypothetical protein IT434_16795 [Phycisphaerales bacterium]|nr:hypothetical protein [Phycisphaerales bacterium]